MKCPLLVNKIREEHNLSILQIDDTLMLAARYYTQLQANLNTMNGHNQGPYATNTNAQHGASANVVIAFGGQLRWSAGNADVGRRNPQEVVDAWMNSSEHRRYILSHEHQFIGMGTTFGGRWGAFHYLFLSN